MAFVPVPGDYIVSRLHMGHGLQLGQVLRSGWLCLGVDINNSPPTKIKAFLPFCKICHFLFKFQVLSKLC